jgi:hypothetical protein
MRNANQVNKQNHAQEAGDGGNVLNPEERKKLISALKREANAGDNIAKALLLVADSAIRRGSATIPTISARGSF